MASIVVFSPLVLAGPKKADGGPGTKHALAVLSTCTSKVGCTVAAEYAPIKLLHQDSKVAVHSRVSTNSTQIHTSASLSQVGLPA